MRQITIWLNRLKKFRDHPLAVVPFLKKYFYFRLVGDSYISLYKDISWLDYNETIEEILQHPRSIVRFGDDVFDMLIGIGLYFNEWRQKYDAKLANRLKEVLSSRDERLLVCFNPELILKTKEEFQAMGIPEQHHFWINSRVYLKDYIHHDVVYGRALAFQELYNPQVPYERIIAHLKTKHLIIVASNTARFAGKQFGLTTDYIEGPASDAWDSYDPLLAQVLEVAKRYKPEETLIMTSLGPTSKVMVYDLTSLGYVSWDTGQFFDLALRKISKLD
jgi:Glycosyltransferase GT-D fold